MKSRQFWTFVAVWTLLAMGPALAADGDARAAIAAAEQAVADAAAARSLWTSADEALRRARTAFEAGDSVAASHWAQTAAEQARLGLAQKQYPLTR